MTELTLPDAAIHALIEHELRPTIQKTLEKAKSAGQGILQYLSQAQLNGLSELVIHTTTVKEIEEALVERNKKRWATEGRTSPYKGLKDDMAEIRQWVDEFTQKVRQRLDSTDQKSAPFDADQIYLELVQRYLLSSVTYARSSKEAGGIQ